MDKDSIIAKLREAGISVVSETRLNNDTGWCLRTDGGAIVNCFDTGNTNVQGKNQEPVKAALGVGTTLAPGGGNTSRQEPSRASRKVFVVYGHDEMAKTELEAMLRRWGLEPLILDQLPSGGQTIIEKLESIRTQAMFAVVLATPDDEGHRIGRPDENAYRARQNVGLGTWDDACHLGAP